MKLAALLFAVACFGISFYPGPARPSSIYDSNVIQHLQLTGSQKEEMQKVIAASRARRHRIFKKYGIDPNAKPKLMLLWRASSELRQNASRERAAAKKILNSKQFQLYDAVIRATRRRIIASF
jgi:hypothetical protein